jgi:hypothetical protein
VTDLDDDAEWIVLLTDELTTRQQHGNLVIELPPIAVVQLAGLLQLARARPDLTPPFEATAAALLVMVRHYFADCPTVLDVLADGDDPTADDVRPLHLRTQTRH